MSSITASEVQPRLRKASTRRDLLVLWQNADTRAIDVVGRLTFDAQTYRFAYSRRAASVDGFRPLPGLRDMTRLYESSALFPLFAQRVMDPSRPGYERYVTRLGLTPEETTPWEQIVRSGGRREGDTLQFLPAPTVHDGVAEAIFLAHGVRWIAGKALHVDGGPREITATEQEWALASLQRGDELGLLAEPGNPKSPLATLVTAQGVPVGYIPQILVGAVSRLGGSARLRVVTVNGPDAPPHLRLIVRLEASVDGEFAFDPEGDWNPVAG